MATLTRPIPPIPRIPRTLFLGSWPREARFSRPPAVIGPCHFPVGEYDQSLHQNIYISPSHKSLTFPESSNRHMSLAQSTNHQEDSNVGCRIVDRNRGTGHGDASLRASG